MTEIVAFAALTFAAGLLVALNEAARPLRPHRVHRDDSDPSLVIQRCSEDR